MGADQILIKGARDAISGGKIQSFSAEDTKNMRKSTDRFMTAFGGFVKHKKKEQEKQRQIEEKKKLIEEKKLMSQWKHSQTQIINSNEHLAVDDYSELTSELMDNSVLFSEADNEQKAILLNDLNKKTEEINNLKDFQFKVGNDYEAFSEDFLLGKGEYQFQTRDFLTITNGTNRIVKSDDGEYGHVLHNPKIQIERKENLQLLEIELNSLSEQEPQSRDIAKEEQLAISIKNLQSEIDAADINPNIDKVHFNFAELEDLYNEQKIDTDTKKAIMDMGLSSSALGNAVLAGQNQDFNYTTGLQQINKVIADPKTNKRSLIHDDMIGDQKSFYKNLLQAVQTQSYGDVGLLADFNLEEGKIESLDQNLDGDDSQISIVDAEIIVNAIIADTTMLDNYLSHYFTNYLKQNYDAGQASRPSSGSIYQGEEL
tara:strand:- start:3258 stop:4541 length:1284 start_codon:yes stop_codon:yes gene_type:complete